MMNIDARCNRLLIAGLFAGLCMTVPAAAFSTDGPSPTVDVIAPAAADLPEAKTVFENALSAMGGREALKNVKSIMIKATMQTPMGNMSLESYYHNPGRFLIKQIVPGMGEMTMGSDGKTTWALNPMTGYQIVEPQEVESMRNQASIHNIVMQIEKEFTDLKTVERLRFREQDCYKVRMLDKEGQEQFAFFDAENHLLAGMEIKQESPMGSATSTMRFDEWKSYGDIKMFSRMVITQMGMNMIMEMTEVELDKLGKELFTLPAEVKKLADERAAEEAESDESEQSPS